ncbi:MAG TPA: FkbM family methyltransferase [Candidatus Acidoferrum sp.]|nr:FkbM family methyltransferase [Candidatus Acidoferrum sp.]
MRKPAVYIGNDRVLLWTKSGFKMFVDSRDVSIAPHLILEGVYEEHTDAVLRRIVKPGMHVVEIGANVGLFTLLMARCVGAGGSVYAFECDPTLARIARDNLELNGLGQIGTIDERAVSKDDGRHEFRAALRHRGGGTLVHNLQQIPQLTETERETIVVQAVTLDRFAAAYDRKIDFLKIDAEGAEADIIRGGQSIFGNADYPITVMMEFAPAFMRKAGTDPAVQLQELVAAGFRFSRVDDRRRRLVPTDGAELLAREFSDIVMVRP